MSNEFKIKNLKVGGVLKEGSSPAFEAEIYIESTLFCKASNSGIGGKTIFTKLRESEYSESDVYRITKGNKKLEAFIVSEVASLGLTRKRRGVLGGNTEDNIAISEIESLGLKREPSDDVYGGVAKKNKAVTRVQANTAFGADDSGRDVYGESVQVEGTSPSQSLKKKGKLIETLNKIRVEYKDVIDDDAMDHLNALLGYLEK